MEMKNHILNKVAYNVELLGPVFGFCKELRQEKGYIGITAKPKTQRELLTIIHECLHAENWKMSEEEVDRISTEIGSLLWKLGFRRKR